MLLLCEFVIVSFKRTRSHTYLNLRKCSFSLKPQLQWPLLELQHWTVTYGQSYSTLGLYLLSQCQQIEHADFVHFCFHIQESLQSTCASRCCIETAGSLFCTDWTIWPLVLFVKVQCIYACLLQSARECQKGPAFAEPWVIANFSDVLMNVQQKQLCLKSREDHQNHLYT